MTEELAIYEGKEATITKPPDVILHEAQKAAKALTDVIESRKKKLILGGKTYLFNEDWQTVGKFYGITVKTGDAEPCEIEGVKGAKAIAQAIKIDTGTIIGGATAYCMRDEKNWKDKPFFQLASMAQTRAGSKALKNILAWVVVLAGYEPTPAEEIEDREEKSKPKKPEPIQVTSILTSPTAIEAQEYMQDKDDFSEKMENFITPAQMKKIQTQFSELGVTVRENRLQWVNALLTNAGYGAVKSSKELTKAQASLVIEGLEQELKGGKDATN